MVNGDLVSIIIPVFNVKPYLKEAIDSVLFQTYRNLEIILIDDGSADGSGLICDEYAKTDSRIKVVHQKNFGLSSARNRGLDMMNGQAVAFLDSDDAYSQEYIQTMINAMVQTQTDLVICKYTVHKTGGHMTKTEKKQTEPKCGQGYYTRTEALRSLAEGLIDMRAWNKLYKRDLWNYIRFPDGHVYEDRATLFKILDVCSSIYVLDQPLYMYRVRAESIANTYSQTNINDFIYAHKEFETYVQNRIPEIYSNDQLILLKIIRFKGMIVCYIRSPLNKHDVFLQDLKSQILLLGTEILNNDAGLQIRILCWMIRCCPWIVHFSYPYYLFLRHGLKGLFKR